MDETWLDIFLSPSHIIAEVLWTLIENVVLGWLLYGIVFKKYLLPRLRKDIHKEIDKEHNIVH